MSARRDTLQQYVSDMLAVERHILQPIETQRKDERTEAHPAAQDLISRIDTTSRDHIQHLQEQLSLLGGDAFSPVKSAATTVMGIGASAINRIRSEQPVSKALRDDYTALNLAAISYTMLYTTGLALKDGPVTDLAYHFLEDYTPLITEISEVIPQVVAFELSDKSEIINPDSIEQATRRTQAAWDGTNIHLGHHHVWE